MDFTAAIIKLAILIYYSKNHSVLRDVSEQNGTAHGDVCAEINLLS